MGSLSRLVVIDISNQVLTVSDDVEVGWIQSELKSCGYSLPLGKPQQGDQRLFRSIEWNEPHSLAAQHGTWRDWVLGLTLKMADGTLVITGSQAIKSVAGYDVQRLIVGSRGSLAIVTQAIIRITPLGSVAPDVSEQRGPLELIRGYHRCKPGDLEATCDTLLLDRPSGTIWVSSEVNHEVKPHVREAMLRAKHLFDPEGKLNPGVWGFM